jgi:hypothetical protein
MWRQALGVERFNEGSARVRKVLNAKTAASLRGKQLPPDQVERRRETALALDLGQHLRAYDPGDRWTAEELALLGTMPDAAVAARIGRKETAVRAKRSKLVIHWARDRGRPKSRP